MYKNAVFTPDSNAMCLPCPNPYTVEFEVVPKTIFSQCANSFSFMATRGARGGNTLFADSWSNGPLEVKRHGSYEVVIVPSMNDLDRVPTDFTTLTREVVQFLQQSYPSTFGVVLCRLKKGSTDYEPFAYSHDIQANNQLFFPTKHFHMEEAAGYNMHDSPWPSSLSSYNTLQGLGSDSVDDWDHELYSAGTPPWCHDSRSKVMKHENSIDWSKMSNEFRLGPGTQLRCKEIVGQGQNVDIEMPVPFVGEVL